MCAELRPSSVMIEEDGNRRCPDCLAIRTDTRKAEIAIFDAARIASRPTRPQITRMNFSETVAGVRTIEDTSGTVVKQAAPVSLTRGGAAVPLILRGAGFRSTDTFTYSSGITDNTAPVLTGSTVWTLSLLAAGGMAAGEWNIALNGHTYRGILRVR